MDSSQALLFSGLQQRTSQQLHIFELLLSLHPLFHDEQKKILWALTFFKGGRTAK